MIGAQRHLNRVCRQFETWYNIARPYEACGGLPLAMETEPDERAAIRRGGVICNMRLGWALK
jgi:transposase InsO family protein